jgi:hypothetical protein
VRGNGRYAGLPELPPPKKRIVAPPKKEDAAVTEEPTPPTAIEPETDDKLPPDAEPVMPSKPLEPPPPAEVEP